MNDQPLVFIVDDDDAIRESLSFLLGTAGLDSQAFESAERFLEAFDPAASGCILTDVRMPGLSGTDLLRKLNALESPVPVIVMTGHADVPLAVEAMKLGASDFIEKPFDDDVLIASIRSALVRGTGDGARNAEKFAAADRMAALSSREREVLDGLLAGKANKVIAFDLGISPRTVEVYRANVMAKMQASSLSDLVRMGLLVSG